MPYIIVENFPVPELAQIVQDDNWENLVLETYEEAQAECELLQNGIIVEV